MAQKFLHNLPHIDHYFNEVPNEIVIPDSPSDIFAWNTKLKDIPIYIISYYL